MEYRQTAHNETVGKVILHKKYASKRVYIIEMKGIYASLGNGFPSPVEFATKNTSGEWTLHFGIVTAMDFSGNKIIVQNPYGYEETYTIKDFIRATRYECYENMEWYFKAGFNMGLFHWMDICIDKRFG
ncbi:hypothetical protein AGMMS49928_25110 [Spirochaetia bacterium]|nr:hypothetical protein AGMMS49928_25110 [Spirochaetia bacterium]